MREVNQKNGWNCLHYSCGYGHSEVTEYTLNHGAIWSSYWHFEKGLNPLDLAIQNSHE